MTKEYHDWRQTLEKRPATASLEGVTTSPGATPMTEEEQELPAEERHECDLCGGSWWSPMNSMCPCREGRDGGLKFDADKPRMELLIQGMPRALEAVGQVLTFGAIKYEAHSWKLVEDNHNRYWAAKSRHELARAKGETHDPETGLLHLAHEACNALFLLELALMVED